FYFFVVVKEFFIDEFVVCLCDLFLCLMLCVLSRLPQHIVFFYYLSQRPYRLLSCARRAVVLFLIVELLRTGKGKPLVFSAVLD
ncbi:MAG: hypothetical protein OEL66_08520, partial [Desulfobulbaceae bacterium]|nr:hypothetical protein [Desulfobulbaceae bacterium]